MNDPKPGPTDTAPPPPETKTPPLPIPLPQPASLLLDEAIARKESLAARGRLQTGCHELDEHVLLGGLERGSVVGVSAEEEGVGLAIGLQTVAGLLVAVPAARVMVVTTLPVAGLLPKLRAALVGRLAREGMQRLQDGVKGCLGRISIARVFDIEGLWEVLRELEEAVAKADNRPQEPVQQTEVVNKPGDVLPESVNHQEPQRTEVLDSEDEGGLSSPESPPPPTSPPDKTTTAEQTTLSTLPDMILITHTSTLLNTLFTGRDKETAHNTTQLLATHLHALTRSPSHGGPLIMLLNSTTSPHHPNNNNATTAPPPDSDRPPKQLDSTLRSIFNPPTAPQRGHGSAFATTRKSKPSFGLVFSQMLDLHLLCTRVPRTRADRVALAANPGAAGLEASYVWLVEVLLDELGVYQRDAGGEWDWWERRNREQRWGAVDIDGEGKVVDAPFS